MELNKNFHFKNEVKGILQMLQKKKYEKSKIKLK